MTRWHARRPGWSHEPLWLRAVRAIATLLAAIAVGFGFWGLYVMAWLASTPAPR
ncbi:MAG TPA: hypothetical protein VFI34_07715 [Candidatus Limnocylindrales bacterium]|nr:hypothetical protein [Candidatus Limnocylindrales bacterium]